jgi:predicted transcriptional regulator
VVVYFSVYREVYAMSHTTIRINERTREVLRDLARIRHESMQAVLEMAVEEYRRKRFLEDLNAAYAEQRKDCAAWKELESERAVWDSTLGDGLEEDEVWDEKGVVRTKGAKKG